MRKNSDENFFEFTREHWQEYYEKPLSDNDVDEIIKNFTELFAIIRS